MAAAGMERVNLRFSFASFSSASEMPKGSSDVSNLGARTAQGSFSSVAAAGTGVSKAESNEN